MTDQNPELTCQQFVEFIRDHMEGSLPADVSASFKAHIALCPPCVDYLDALHKTRDIAKLACTHPDDELPPDLPEGLVRAVLASRRKSS